LSCGDRSSANRMDRLLPPRRAQRDVAQRQRSERLFALRPKSAARPSTDCPRTTETFGARCRTTRCVGVRFRPAAYCDREGVLRGAETIVAGLFSWHGSMPTIGLRCVRWNRPTILRFLPTMWPLHANSCPRPSGGGATLPRLRYPHCKDIDRKIEKDRPQDD
jgi:hypothetical protein